ncbi:hypothetical protein B1R94_14600 [Mycolicibacterium litorale]|nr:hypothetical protein B1R94_14600 [Mycolicibacterium litorale]
MPWVGGLFIALGVGAALLAGSGDAHADTPDHGAQRAGNAAHATPRATGHRGPPASSTAVRFRTSPVRISAATGLPSTQSRTATTIADASPAPARAVARPTARRPPGARVAHPAPRPAIPVLPQAPDVIGVVTTWLDEVRDCLIGTNENLPRPADMAPTPYGDIGKWMLTPAGGVADWFSQGFPFTTLYQPINVVIVDPTSTTAEEAAAKLNAAMAAAGFPAQQIHASGYRGVIDGISYGQQPAGILQAFSDAHWLLTNDHGRVFGPAPAPDGSGYVWTASFSRERTGLVYIIPGHVYVSFNQARDSVRDALVGAGATDLGVVDLDNTLSGRSTTGDHDGYAVVIKLN